MNTENTFGISFYLKKAKANQNGKCPLCARITVNGKRIEISLKQSIQENDWNAVKGMAKGSRKEIVALNNYLERYRASVVNCYRELSLEKKLITAELMRARLLGSENSEYTLCNLMKYHNEEQKKLLTWGTMKNYMTTQKYIHAFLQEKYKTSDKYLSELSYKFLTEFDYYLRSQRDEYGKPTLANNGVMKHVERLRKMVNLAIRLEWIDKNPFIAYKLKFDRVERQFLTGEELGRIEEKVFSLDRLELVKDLFVFSCYTGLAYIDTVNLTPHHLVTGTDGGLWLNTQRQKTHSSVKIPLLPKALAVIQKYKSHPKVSSEGKLLPTFSNQKLNSYLKEIADLCGITKPLTFHIARHTFATSITLSNGVPIETVSKLLGHTKLTTTQIYAKVIDKKVGDDMGRLKETLLAQA